MTVKQIREGLSNAMGAVKKARVLMIIPSTEADDMIAALKGAFHMLESAKETQKEKQAFRLQIRELEHQLSVAKGETGKPAPFYPMPHIPNVDNIILYRVLEAVCKVLKISADRVICKSRERKAVLARQLAMFMARRTTDSSFNQIGRFFQRDHSTVIHACVTIEDMIKTGQGNVYKKYRECLMQLDLGGIHDTERKELAADIQLNKAG